MLIQMNVGKLEGEAEPVILVNPETGTMLKYWPGKMKKGGIHLAVHFTLPGCKDMEIFHSKKDLMDFINAWVEANGGIKLTTTVLTPDEAIAMTPEDMREEAHSAAAALSRIFGR